MRELIAKPGRWWIALSWLWVMFFLAMLSSPTFAPSLQDYIGSLVFIALPPLAALWLKTVYLYLRKRL